MTTNTVYLTGDACCGLTFLDWSLYYFSGARKFYNPLSATWEIVVDNPLHKLNAHRHKRIQPLSLKSMKYCIDEINLRAKDYFHSIYVCPVITESGFDISKFIRDDTYDDANFWDQQGLGLINETISGINNFLVQSNSKILVLRTNKEDILYDIFNSGRPHNSTADNELMKLHNKFFSKNSKFWGDQVKIWDQRENMALSLRPFNHICHEINITSTNHYEITVGDMLDNLDKEIYNILDFFNITPVGDYTVWKSLYRQWQQIHDLRFYRSWEEIINNIIQGVDVDLTNYRMDFSKDVFIQHILIYQHNLNIKGYGLEKLPKNTKLIHALLEPNMHHVDQIYI